MNVFSVSPSPLPLFGVLLGILLIRYFAVSGAFFLAIDVWGGARWQARKLSSRPRDLRLIRHDLAYSVGSCAIFAVFGAGLILAWHAGATRIYLDWDRHGLLYLPLSFVLYAFLHETYFYWTHRWMHLPKVFQKVHAVHHRSRYPTAWTSFAFHPVEAVVQAAFVPALCLLIPIHAAVLFAFLTAMTVLGVVNHLGYEVYPERLSRLSVFRWWISVTHHSRHHERTTGNYGLYVTVWDRWMGTNHESPAVVSGRSAAQSDPLVIVGGGLWGSLVAYRILDTQPQTRLILLEASDRWGGNHTWSFHEGDLTGSQMEWVAPLVSRSWTSHSVQFPSVSRVLASGYHSIRSEDFHARVRERLAPVTRFGASVSRLDATQVELSSGQKIQASVVLDARGMSARRPIDGGFQKFVGLELELETAHGLSAPVLMDATVEQKDGFRFIYLLPWDDHRVLVEDTRYSDSNSIDSQEYEASILDYARKRNWKVARILRREQGALPIPFADPVRERSTGALPLGLRAGIFHDTTGYSLPDAVRVADRIASLPEFSVSSVGEALRVQAGSRALSRAFLRALNRMLFRSALPGERYRVLEKFYRLPADTVSRFYAGRLGLLDAARILSGKPPVPVGKALGSIFFYRKAAS